MKAKKVTAIILAGAICAAAFTGCGIEHFGNADAVPQPPKRCLSRKAGIVRYCHNSILSPLKFFARTFFKKAANLP